MKLNLTNIKQGDTIKNYKTLCNLLNEPVLQGNSKVRQLSEWECHFKFSKDGHKFIINEIYTKPKQRNESKGGLYNRTEYINNIQHLILDLVSQSESGHVFLSKNKLLKSLNMINGNFVLCKNRIPKLSNHLNIEQTTIQEFYESSNDMLIRNINSALNKLRSKALIYWNTAMTVCDVDVYISLNQRDSIQIDRQYKTYDEYGEENNNYSLSYRTKEIHRKATEDERKFIIKTEHDIMAQLRCTNKQEVIAQGLWNIFNNRVKEVLLTELNIAFYYDSYEIVFNQEHVQAELVRLNNDERIKQQQDLNSGVHKRVNTNVLNRHKKALTSIKETKVIQNRRNKEYVLDSKLLSNVLIKDEAKSIYKDIKYMKL